MTTFFNSEIFKSNSESFWYFSSLALNNSFNACWTLDEEVLGILSIVTILAEVAFSLISVILFIVSLKLFSALVALVLSISNLFSISNSLLFTVLVNVLTLSFKLLWLLSSSIILSDKNFSWLSS